MPLTHVHCRRCGWYLGRVIQRGKAWCPRCRVMTACPKPGTQRRARLLVKKILEHKGLEADECAVQIEMNRLKRSGVSTMGELMKLARRMGAVDGDGATREATTSAVREYGGCQR